MEPINQLVLERGRRVLAGDGLPGKRPAKFLFVSISGAHLYGFPSPDSDIDLRGAHLLPMRDVLGLQEPDETYESAGGLIDGLEIDCVSHDLKKYFRLLAHKNGYVLEQIFSPLVVFDGGCLEEIRALAKGAMTRHVVHHYKGFFRNQEKLTLKDDAPTAKSVLYLFRVVMTGLHVLRTGEVEAHLETLNAGTFKLPYIADLIARKRAGAEFGRLVPGEFQRYLADAKRLEAELDSAFEKSCLPEEVQNYAALDEFLKRMRRSFE